MSRNYKYFKVFILCICGMCVLTVAATLITVVRGDRREVINEYDQNNVTTPVIHQPQSEKEEEEVFLILNEASGKVEKIGAYDYCLGAVIAEMPPTFHIEALKAQALSAYTRARYLKKQFMEGKGEYENAHFSQDPDSNKGFVRLSNVKKLYGNNYNIWFNKMKVAALYAIEREITYEGEPIVAAYHAISAGSTEKSENVWISSLPYLDSVDSNWDSFSQDYESKVEIPFDKAREILKTAYPKGNFPVGGENGYLVPLEYSQGGYVTKISAGGEIGDGCEIRKIFSLRSAAFDVKTTSQSLVFTVRGYGHGVGLSQVGADFMARQGSEAEEILEHYYQGAQVKLKS